MYKVFIETDNMIQEFDVTADSAEEAKAMTQEAMFNLIDELPPEIHLVQTTEK